jgi:predicted helicase
LYGKRNEKYSFLLDNNLKTVDWTELPLQAPQYFFVQKNFGNQQEYEQGFAIQELFPVNVMGFQTHRDDFAIGFTESDIRQRALDLRNKDLSNEEICMKYAISNNRDWNLSKARATIQQDKNWENKIINCSYRTLDNRPCYFSCVMMDYPRKELIQHVLNRDNLCLNFVKQTKMNFWGHVLISKNPTPALFIEIKDGSNVFPLYLYPEIDKLFSDKKRKPNLNRDIVNEISQRIGWSFTEEKDETENTFAPIDILDYIYAVLHSPLYRERYKEFLKIDFPRAPYPQDAAQFRELATLGAKLRRLHLMEGVEPSPDMATYPKEGSNEVEKPKYITGKVYINDVQYFDNVPLEAWEFYIGGYQPAQKWLKDRKGRILGYEDIVHYQQMIRVLWETGEVMREMEKLKK